jgi:hypothetical protein
MAKKTENPSGRKPTKEKRDFSQIALSVVEKATGQPIRTKNGSRK